MLQENLQNFTSLCLLLVFLKWDHSLLKVIIDNYIHFHNSWLIYKTSRGNFVIWGDFLPPICLTTEVVCIFFSY